MMKKYVLIYCFSSKIPLLIYLYLHFITKYVKIQENRAFISGQKVQKEKAVGKEFKEISEIKGEKVFREISDVKGSLHFRLENKIDWFAHIHEDIELVYVKRGEATAFCNGVKYDLCDNSFFMVFPNQIHHYVDSVSGEYFVLKINPSQLFAFNSIFLEGDPVSPLWHFEVGEDDNTATLFEMALFEFLRDGYSPIIDAYLTALFGKLFKFYEIEKGKVSRDTVLKILQYCSEHYKEHITVADVASDLSISRSTVSHIFSARLGINFCEYINSLRLSEAEQLLKNGSCSITEISNIAGFTDVRTFNRAFLKRHGVSPSVYRKDLKK